MGLEAIFDLAREIAVHLAVVVPLSDWPHGVPTDKGVELGARGKPEYHVTEGGDKRVVRTLGVEVGASAIVSSHNGLISGFYGQGHDAYDIRSQA